MKIKKIIFVIVFLTSLSIFGLYALINQEKSNISYLEKRHLSYVETLSVNNWLTRKFQESIDSTITDNFWMRNDWLKYYNKTNMKLNSIGNKILFILFNSKSEQKFSIQKVNEKISFIKELSYLIRNPYIYDETVEKGIKSNIEKINFLHDKYENIEFYIYLPTMPHEANIFDFGTESADYLKLFYETKIPFKKLEIHNIYQLKEMYFKTDHHWTKVGAYRGYTDIIELLFDELENPKIPVNEEKFNDIDFYGSHSRDIAHSIELEGDSISKYVFDLPEYKLYINNVLTEEYGNYGAYVKGVVNNTKGFDHYNWMYQRREAEIIFDTDQKNLDNILVISDSMSNAIRDILASHFNQSIFVNLDKYERDIGDFQIEEYLNRRDIDKVLVMVSLGNYFPTGELKHLK